MLVLLQKTLLLNVGNLENFYENEISEVSNNIHANIYDE